MTCPRNWANSIACWFIDTDYNAESFFVRHAYFLGANDPYKALRRTLKAEIDADAWESLHGYISRPFDPPESGRIAVNSLWQKSAILARPDRSSFVTSQYAEI